MIDFRRLVATALTLTAIAIFTSPVRAADTDHAEILALYQAWIRAVEGSDDVRKLVVLGIAARAYFSSPLRPDLLGYNG